MFSTNTLGHSNEKIYDHQWPTSPCFRAVTCWQYMPQYKFLYLHGAFSWYPDWKMNKWQVELLFSAKGWGPVPQWLHRSTTITLFTLQLYHTHILKTLPIILSKLESKPVIKHRPIVLKRCKATNRKGSVTRAISIDASHAAFLELATGCFSIIALQQSPDGENSCIVRFYNKESTTGRANIV